MGEEIHVIENNLIYGSVLALMWSTIAIMYYLIYNNFKEHPEISSRTLFLSEGTPRAFKVLAAGTAVFIVATMFRIVVLTSVPNLQNTAIYVYRSAAVIVTLASIYWQYCVFRFTLKPSDR